MRVLLVKTSSLGDVIHALPALSDARRNLPEVRFDWLVEEAYADLPVRHPAVDRVIPVALRRWRGSPLRAILSGEVSDFLRQLRARDYDFVIDAQGLIKSGVLTRLASGRRIGMDASSSRESQATLFYRHRLPVCRDLHAVQRIRRLVSLALNYPLPAADDPWGAPDFGLPVEPLSPTSTPYLVFLHGASWPSKAWPLAHWVQLTRLASAAGFEVRLPWGDRQEQLRASHVIAAADAGVLLPRMDLAELRGQLAGASGCVGVDTGLAHLAWALGRPLVMVFGATSAARTGPFGGGQAVGASYPCSPCGKRRCLRLLPEQPDQPPPCYAEISAEQVWKALQQQMA